MNIDIDGLKITALAVAGLLVIVAGIIAILKGRSGQIRDVGGILAAILIAALIIAVGSHLQEVGDWLFNLIF